MIGLQVSRFRILDLLGVGSMGEVYRAEDVDLGRKVAIKFLARELLVDASALARFRHEARNTAELSHPGIASLLEFGTHENRPYLVLEYVPGETLASRLERGPLPIEHVVRVGRLMAEALAFAHTRSIIHRDIKPGNVMLLPDGGVKILDLGLSRKPDSTRITESGAIPGTIAYMSPEQMCGNPADARSDIWGLGVVLYECLAGRLPFEAESAIGTMNKVLGEHAAPVRNLRRGIPASLDQVVDRCLQKSPELRFQHADEVAAQLRLVESQMRVPVAQVATRSRLRLPSLRPVLIGAALVISVAIAAVAAWRVMPRLMSSRGMPSPGATAERRPMVVFPFAEDLPASSRYMVDATRTLLTSVLDGYGVTRCVEARRVDQIMAGDASVLTDDSTARRLAGRLGAERFIQGSFVLVGRTVRLEGRLHFRNGARDTSVTRFAEGNVDSLSSVVESLARKIIVSSLAGTDEVSLGLSSLDTPPLEALQAYQAAIAEPSLASTADHLARATQIDSSFALAWNQLASTQIMLGQGDAAARSTELALRLGNRLPLRARLLQQARAAAQQVDLDRSEHLYRQLLAQFPDNATAWFGLGDDLFLFNTLRGRRTLEARQPFLEAVRLDSTLGRAALSQLERIGMAIGDQAWTDSLYRAHHKSERPGDFSPAAATWLAWARNDTTAQRELFDKAPANTPEVLVWQMFAAADAGDVGAGLKFGRMAVRKQAEPSARAISQLHCAIAAVSGGRIREAREFLRVTDTTDSVYARCLGGLITVSGFIPTSPAELDSLHRALTRLQGTPEAEEREGSPLFSQVEGAVQPVRLYVLGLIAVRAGHVEKAREFAARLAGVTGPSETTVWARNYSQGILAALHAHAARWSDVLSDLSRLRLGTKSSGRVVFHNLLQERFLHAEALRARGDLPGALTWYECMSDVFFVDHVYRGPCELNAAEICDQLGRREEAIRHYRFFCKLWSDCDPELRPLVGRARQRLAQLGAQYR